MNDKEYDNTDRGVLFRNSRKNSDSHPDFQGNVNVAGVEYWLSAWVKEAKKDGSQFLSLSVKKKEPKVVDTASVLTATPVAAAVGDPDDPLPF
jgi:uncharacterized protein (DUF736 family)